MHIPYIRLKHRRKIARILPDELFQFYERHEGICTREVLPICFYTFANLKTCTYHDLFPADTPRNSWRFFSGIEFCGTEFFVKIVYTRSAPVCPDGSILAIGDVPFCYGGTRDGIDGSMLLAHSFNEWIANMTKSDWKDPAIMGLEDASQFVSVIAAHKSRNK